MGVDVAGADRLMMIHKVSLIQLLPEKLRRPHPRHRRGDRGVTHANWFGGLLPGAEQLHREHGGRSRELAADVPGVRGAGGSEEGVVGRPHRRASSAAISAKRFGWKIGDRIPLISPIYRKPDGSPWEFTIDGIYDSPKKGTDKTQFFFHYDYLNETFRNPASWTDQVGWYIVRVAGSCDLRPARQDESTRCSRTRRPKRRPATEKAFVSDFAKQIGDIGAIMIAIAPS